MRWCSVFLLVFLAIVSGIVAQEPAPLDTALRVVDTFLLPGNARGRFDHLEVDTRRKRLFATLENARAVLVLDIATGKVIQQITGIKRPHAVLYRDDLDRLYITDGGDGSLKIYDAGTYKLLERVALSKDADSIGYDPSRKFLYVDNGDADDRKTFSLLSVIDTTTERKVADIGIDGETLEAMSLDKYRPRLYVNDTAKNTVAVIDRMTNTVTATWPVTLGKANVGMALDEQRQRLFVACRDGHLVVLDSNTGNELQELPISKGVDEVIYDAATRRLYTIGAGVVDTFDQTSLNRYAARASISTGSHARTGKFSPELNRLFVAEPGDATHPASIRVLEPVGTRKAEPPLSSPLTHIQAPAAEALVLRSLSEHPFLRRMGLHVIPPGSRQMVLIANGNATRIGIATSASDFAATQGGKTSAPLIEDGAFYNVKMPMFDAQKRDLGILVMEIPATSATGEADAARLAEDIRHELAFSIPSLDWLFTYR